MDTQREPGLVGELLQADLPECAAKAEMNRCPMRS